MARSVGMMRSLGWPLWLVWVIRRVPGGVQVSGRVAVAAVVLVGFATGRWTRPAADSVQRTIDGGIEATAELNSASCAGHDSPRPATAPGSIAVAVMRQFGPGVLPEAAPRPSMAADRSPAPRPPASEAIDFVPVRIDIDIDIEVVRAALTDIAMVWLGADAAPVAEAIAVTRPGVDDFVSTIAAIGRMEIRGHGSPVIRAMSREMHYYAADTLCGV